MIRLSRSALGHIQELERHYEQRDRPDAIRGLYTAIEIASSAIERGVAIGLPYPRPYPKLAREGRFWIKVGRYWFVYQAFAELSIVGIFYETADIPTRLVD